MNELAVSDYANAIALHDGFASQNLSLSEEEEQALVKALLDELEGTLGQPGIHDYRQQSAGRWRTLLDAAITILPPDTLSRDNIVNLDRLLQSELTKRKTVDAKELADTSVFSVSDTQIMLWQGDITTLEVDAIVNAANNQMLGCFLPQHKCIDNAIHNRAGVQLRSDCQRIMAQQGDPEPTGQAKITRAYNLPSKYVIHTVGPVVEGGVTRDHETLLASCYASVLGITRELDDLRSVALCCISTGVFGYPIEQATPLAIQKVTDWLQDHPGHLDSVIFNVFSTRDLQVYQSAMEVFK